MGNVLLGSRRGQGLLESTMAMVIGLIFLAGIFVIWQWGNTQMVQRQINYNKSRVSAGTSSDSYKLAWPVGGASSLSESAVLAGSE